MKRRIVGIIASIIVISNQFNNENNMEINLAKTVIEELVLLYKRREMAAILFELQLIADVLLYMRRKDEWNWWAIRYGNKYQRQLFKYY